MKDPNFDESLYPHNEKDYSLKVMQIAESTNGELFVYAYQPSAPTYFLMASSLVLSTEDDPENRKYVEYPLTLLSSSSVFHKYRVDNFTVKKDEERYYSISEIFRSFNSQLDKSPEDDNVINYKAFPVGQFWTVSGSGSDISYDVVNEDVIDITEQHAGFLRYEGGVLWFDDDVDSHYVAFSTDHLIDALLEVDIKYHIKQRYVEAPSTDITTEEDIEDTLYADEIFDVNISNFFKEKNYTYYRIQSTDAFLKAEGVSLNEDTQSFIQGMEWVLRFYETDYINTLQTDQLGFLYGKYTETIVTEVRMFRLKYEYQGEIYNLGVVGDSISGDRNPDGTTKVEYEEWWQKLVAIILGGFLVLMLWQFIPSLLMSAIKFIITGCVSFLKLLLGIASLPIRLIFKPKKKERW